MKKLANITTSYPRTIIVITLILTVFFGYFATRVTMTTNIKEFFPQDDPRVMTYDRVEAEFGGAEYIMLALEAEDLFTPETIRNIDLITRDLEQIEGVANVRSLTSVDEIKGTEWGLKLSPLVQELPSTAAAAEKLKKKVLADELYGGVLVAEDASAGLIIVEVQPDFDSVALAGVIDQRIREYSIPEKLYLTGTPVLNNLLASSMQQDLKKLFPVVLLIIAMVLFLHFGDFKGVALPFATVFISLIWTLGLMGILGKKLSPLNAVMPIILVCLGNAYGIYLLNRFREESSGDKKRGAVVVAAMIAVGPAIIMAGVTTVAGFASNLFSGITLMRDFGLFTSYGVAIALMVSLTFIPAVLAVLPSRRSVQANKRGGGKTLRLVSGWVVKYPRRIIVVSFLLIVAAVFGLPRLRTDSNFFNFFPDQSQPKIAYNLVKEKFTGSESVEIVVEGDLLDPQLLAAMKGFQDDLKATGLTGEPTSLVNILERTNQAMHEDDPDYKKVPDDEALIAQYLLLLEMSDDRYLSKFVTPDYGQARIQALVKNTSSSGTTGLLAAITALKDKHFSSEAVKVTETGIIVLIDALADMIIEGQISGLIFSMLAVLVILLLLLHSWQGSILSTFLIGAVTLINFGVMGWFGIPLDIVTVLISSIGVGVGIDYSIHIYSSYLEGKKNGLTAVEAVTVAVTGTGKSIISNAVAVISGFIVLVGSTFPPFRYFGILVSSIMFFAATGALLFIPAVTVWQTSRQRKKKNKYGGLKMKKIWIYVVMALITVMSAFGAAAAPESGEVVLAKLDATMKAEQKYMEQEMVLVTASGAERSRTVAVWNKIVDDEEMMLLRFLGPANVKGTGFLMKNDDMWLYLPALGKVKRIAGSAKQGSFMGSDLSYEDMEALGSKGFAQTHQVKGINETKYGEASVYQLVLSPQDGAGSYSELEILVDQELYLPLQIIYYGRDGQALKKLTTFDHQQVDGRWVASRLQMEDLKKGSKTVLKVNKVDFKATIDDSVFNTRSLERGI